MVWLLVFVVCGAVVLLGPVWREISEHITRGDLLEAVVFFPFIYTTFFVSCCLRNVSTYLPTHSKFANVTWNNVDGLTFDRAVTGRHTLK